MKKSVIYLLMVVTATVFTTLSLTSCNEDVQNENVQNDRPKESKKSEFSTEVKKSIAQKSVGEGTRTTCDEDRFFYWTHGDNIWVEKTAGSWILSDTNSITTTQASAKFYFDDTLAEDSYNVRYTGQGSTSATSVKIASSQTQSVWNNGDHIAVSGDCGLATATHQGGRKYKFSLKHQASYIILYPYMVPSISPPHYTLDRTYTLMKVEVKSADNAEIAGTYSFGTAGITGSATSGGTDMITLNCGTDGFLLDNDSNTKHYIVIVMRPVENNKLTFKYYIKDNTDGTIITYAESPGMRTYNPNGFTITRHSIPDMVLNLPRYYKWGAAETYTSNGLWDKITGAGLSKSGGVWNSSIPNANELYWYATTAIPNNNIRWRIEGESTIHTNIIWIKKKAYIDGFSSTKAPDNKNWCNADSINGLVGNGDIYRHDNPPTGSPVPGIIHQYTFLPCFGLYHQTYPGDYTSFGGTAYYWGRTAGKVGKDVQSAVRFGASPATVNVNLQDRRHGMVVGPDWFQ